MLFLALFLGSIPFSVPNARVVRDVLDVANFIGDCLLPFHAAALTASLILIVSSRQGKDHMLLGIGVRRIAVFVYLICTTVLYAMLLCDAAPGFAVEMICVLAGAATMPIVAEWIRMYRLDVRDILFYGALCCAISILIGWVPVLLPPIGYAVFNCICAITGCAPLLREREIVVAKPVVQTHGSLRDFFSILWMPFAGLLVCVFLSGLCEFSIDGVTLRSEFISGLIASFIALAVCLMPHEKPLVMVVDFLVVPMLIALVIVLGSFRSGAVPFFVGAATVFSPLMFVSLFALSSLAAAVATGEFEPGFILGVSFGAVNLATLMGIIAGLLTADTIVGPFAFVMVYVYFGIAIMNIGYVAWRQISRSGHDDAADTEPERDALSESAEETWQRQIDLLSERHGLTDREHELLGYMSRGYGSVYISKALFISDNTARTHIRNIYRKLGVHSREELIALFN